MKTKYIQIDEWSTHWTVKLRDNHKVQPLEIQVCSKRNSPYLKKIIKDLKSMHKISEVIESKRAV
jgi:hypothetical protein